MAAGIALSTAGVTLGYAVEVTSGVKPTANYTIINDVKSIPELNSEPDSLETTDLSATEYKTYIQGLRDPGGTLSFTANFTTQLETDWATLVSAYATGIAASKETWFEIKHPSLSKSVFFKGQPAALGIPGMEVGQVLETNLFITVTSEPGWDTKSTVSAG